MTHFDAFLRNVVFYVKDLYYYTTRNHKTPLECKPSREHAIIRHTSFRTLLDILLPLMTEVMTSLYLIANR